MPYSSSNLKCIYAQTSIPFPQSLYLDKYAKKKGEKQLVLPESRRGLPESQDYS
jgi:hypothetical protein